MSALRASRPSGEDLGIDPCLASRPQLKPCPFKASLPQGLLLISLRVVSIKVLYILLVIGTGLVLWAAVAIYLRVRRHLRAASDHALRETTGEVPRGQKVSKE
jgi:hypothetical protein